MINLSREKQLRIWFLAVIKGSGQFSCAALIWVVSDVKLNSLVLCTMSHIYGTGKTNHKYFQK